MPFLMKIWLFISIKEENKPSFCSGSCDECHATWNFFEISVISNCHVMEVCLVMAVLPLHGSSCFHLTAEPNFPNLPHTPWSCRKWCYQIFQHSILLLALKSRNKSPGMYMLILTKPVKKKNYVFLPLHRRNTKNF